MSSRAPTATAAAHLRPLPHDAATAEAALAEEARLDYRTPTGRYWEEAHRFDPAALDRIDALWRAAATPAEARRLSHR